MVNITDTTGVWRLESPHLLARFDIAKKSIRLKKLLLTLAETLLNLITIDKTNRGRYRMDSGGFR